MERQSIGATEGYLLGYLLLAPRIESALVLDRAQKFEASQAQRSLLENRHINPEQQH